MKSEKREKLKRKREKLPVVFFFAEKKKCAERDRGRKHESDVRER